MTLSRFLRDYLYIPLGGNRKETLRRYINVMVTMLLRGLWHGANWTFVMWGGLHGFYVLIHHAWHTMRHTMGHDLTNSTASGRVFARAVTFVVVVIAWVFFRSPSTDAAYTMLSGMAGQYGFVLQGDLGLHWAQWAVVGDLPGALFKGPNELLWIGGLLAIVWLAPNTQQIIQDIVPPFQQMIQKPADLWFWLQWRPHWGWATASTVMFVWGLLHILRTSEFLYFQF